MSSSVSSSTFSQRLKEATSILQQQLEDLPISKAILKLDVTGEEYLHYLDLMYDVISDVETEIFPLLTDEVKDLENRRKIQLMNSDFVALDYSKKSNFKILDGKNHSRGFAMGILYVIEGSSLGGRVIYKHIQKQLGLDSIHGAAYFAGYGEDTGSNWKSFMTTLVAYEKKHNNSDEIIEGANYTFQTIKTHLEGGIKL